MDQNFSLYIGLEDADLAFGDNLSRYMFNMINDEIRLLSLYNNDNNTPSIFLNDENISIRFSSLMFGLDTPPPSVVDDNICLSEKQISSIDKQILSETIECYICLDKLLPGSCVHVLRCGHRFCIDCIESWLSKYNKICPMCRSECIVE